MGSAITIRRKGSDPFDYGESGPNRPLRGLIEPVLIEPTSLGALPPTYGETDDRR